MPEDLIKIMKDAQKQRHDNLSNAQKKRNRLNLTLEEDLTMCFKVRGIEVEEISIWQGATKYEIRVRRKEPWIQTSFSTRN
jgi:hypothetical protein